MGGGAGVERRIMMEPNFTIREYHDFLLITRRSDGKTHVLNTDEFDSGKESGNFYADEDDAEREIDGWIDDGKYPEWE